MLHPHICLPLVFKRKRDERSDPICFQLPDHLVLFSAPRPWSRLLGRCLIVSHTPPNFFIDSAILLAAEASLLALGLHK